MGTWKVKVGGRRDWGFFSEKARGTLKGGGGALVAFRGGTSTWPPTREMEIPPGSVIYHLPLAIASLLRLPVRARAPCTLCVLYDFKSERAGPSDTWNREGGSD